MDLLIRTLFTPSAFKNPDSLLFSFVYSIAVHPAGNCYASGGEDGFVRVHHYDDSYFKAKPYGDIEIEE